MSPPSLSLFLWQIRRHARPSLALNVLTSRAARPSRPSSFPSASAALLLCYFCCLLPPVPLPSAVAARGRAQFLTVLPASLDPQPSHAPSRSPLALSITMAMALRVRMCTAKRPADSLDMGLALV